jgi:hypothetical protein
MLVVIFIILLGILCVSRIGSDEHFTQHPHYVDFEDIGSISLDGEGGAKMFFYIYEQDPTASIG